MYLFVRTWNRNSTSFVLSSRIAELTSSPPIIPASYSPATLYTISRVAKQNIPKMIDNVGNQSERLDNTVTNRDSRSPAEAFREDGIAGLRNVQDADIIAKCREVSDWSYTHPGTIMKKLFPGTEH